MQMPPNCCKENILNHELIDKKILLWFSTINCGNFQNYYCCCNKTYLKKERFNQNATTSDDGKRDDILSNSNTSIAFEATIINAS